MIGARFVLLQTVLAASLAALWFTGPLAHLAHGESRWFCAGVGLVALTGVACIALGRFGDARWLGNNLLPLAVIGMQIGIIAGLGAAAEQVASGGDMARAVGQFFGAVTVALQVSVTALAGYLWIDLNLRLLGGGDA